MHIRTRRRVAPFGAVAAVTLALGAAGTIQHSAFADEHSQPSASVVDYTLFVTGSDGPDAIALAATAATMTVNFAGAAPAQVFDRTTFTAISVSLGSGQDMFTVDSQGQFSNIPLTVDGGRGDDFIRGSDGNDVIFGGRGDDDVDGGRGTDTEILGRGADTALWLPGEASDVIDGGRGSDTLTFIGSGGNEAFTIVPDGGAAVLTRDLGGIRMHMIRVEAVNLQALGGTDQVTVGDLSGTDLRLADVRLSSSGASDGASDGVLDVVSIQGTEQADHVTVGADGSTVDIAGLRTETRISGGDTRDQLHVNTGAGDDSVTVSSAAASLLEVSTDLGADQH